MGNDNHFKSEMLKIQQDYLAETGRVQFTLAELGEWAINNKRYDVPFANKLKNFCEAMRGILQHETHTDPDGRQVRTWACAKSAIAKADGTTEQGRFWADSRKASPNFMLTAFRERFRGARADARKVQAEVESWNKFNRPKKFPPITFDWDFSSEQGDESAGSVA